ncbi:phage tail length tape measure family protein [Escherichia coli]|nr:phage tail length tape measure family protein [Escherichia coli]
MNISNSQVNRLRHFVRAGLRSLFRPEPQTAVEWADANYYLPKESAYQEGRWETLPFQRAIMNAMGSDYIREVNVVKSARVGQSPWLILLQQGGQVKDSFGGMIPMFRGLPEHGTGRRTGGLGAVRQPAGES